MRETADPQTTVAAILTDSEDADARILLTRRTCEPYTGRWCLPGGHIEAGEPAEQAVKREIQEETGLLFHPRLFAAFDEIIPEIDRHSVVLVFHGVPSGGRIRSEEGEVNEIKWFALRDAIELDLAFDHRGILRQWDRHLPEKQVLAEYAALRGEVTSRITTRWQIEMVTILFSTGFVALASTEAVSGFLCVAAPLVVLLLAAAWAHNDSRIAQIGRFIREEIENCHDGIRWEGHLRRLFAEGYWTKRDILAAWALRMVRWLVRKRVLVRVLPLFMISAMVVPGAAWATGSVEASFFSHVLTLFVTFISVVVIALIVGARHLRSTSWRGD